MKRIVLAVSLCVLLGGTGFARREPPGCGTHQQTPRERLFLHKRAEAARKVSGAARLKASGAAPASRDAGDIVIMDDGDGVAGRLNAFNLDGRTVAFAPASAEASSYRFETRGGSYSPEDAAGGGRLELDDDDTIETALPFAFPYFGTRYEKVWVNSDGNLTFTAGDGTSAERSLGRLTAGPPRIAGLFTDLDPSRSVSGVRLLSRPDRVVITWSRVPEYRESGIGPLQTFQVRLYPGGSIELAYEGVPIREAVVGISRGRLQGSSALVSFAGGSTAVYTSTVAERFTANLEIDVVTAAQKFYENHDDAYDYLVFINNLGIRASDGAVAYESTVRTGRTGIGDKKVDIGQEYGSASRLQAVINLGPLSQYPADPYAVVPARSFSRDTTMSVLAHEAGHLFLAFASTRDPEGPRERPLLCSDLAHWSFTFHSDASLVSGNRIRDNGPDVSPRFTTVATVESYSLLDRYLMGLVPASQVPPSFYVSNSRGASASSCLPVPGVSFDGERREVKVEEIIAAEGRLTPDHTVSQRTYRFAFIFIVGKGSEPAPEQLAQVDRYRREFESFFQRATGELAVAETSLQRSLKLSVFPAAGLLAGRTASATVSIAAPAEASLTILLRTSTGAASTPASVTIPEGRREVSFPLTGVREGVDRLTAEAADARYERPTAALQVLAAPAALKVEVVSGSGQFAVPGQALRQPVVVRVSDDNNLPYPGLAVNVSVAGGGSVSPAAVVTDAAGLARLSWTPGGGENRLSLSLAGSTAPPAVVTAAARPAIAPGAVVNAASFRPGIALGSLVTIFGSNLAAGAGAQAAPPVPRLAEVQVFVGGTPVPLLFVSDRQINFYAPPDLRPGPADVTVSSPAGVSAPVSAEVVEYQPAVFFDPATGRGAAIRRGEYLEIYCTGLGPVRESQAPGLQETVTRPAVFVGDSPVEVSFSGLAPGYPGLYQVNARVPPGSGAAQLYIEAGGSRSNQVTAP